MPTKKLRIDVWSDIACPWCYVGKRRLEAALKKFPHRDEVDIVWRAFELDPSAPRENPTDFEYIDHVAKKVGASVDEAKGMLARVTETAAGDGLDFHLEKVRAGNTFDAHRVLHLALERGKQDAVKERYLLAYMTEGESIGDPDALVRLAAEAGLDAEEVCATLASDMYAREVREDEDEARKLRIGGVPFFVLAGKLAMSGAQPAESLLHALTQAWKEVEAQPAVFAEGAVCGPDGCA